MPKFVKRHADLKETIGGVVHAYMEAVLTQAFPGEQHIFIHQRVEILNGRVLFV